MDGAGAKHFLHAFPGPLNNLVYDFLPASLRAPTCGLAEAFGLAFCFRLNAFELGRKREKARSVKKKGRKIIGRGAAT